MTVSRSLERLLEASRADDVLAVACREAIAASGAQHGFATCCLPRQRWDRGLHIEHRDGHVTAARPAARSALFAVHRRLALRTAPVAFERDAAAAIFSGLGCDAAARSVYALPIVHRTGRLWGELVVVGARVTDGLDEVARHAAMGLENAQRLAFARRDQERLVLLAEATDDALYDHDFDTKDFWWGGGILKLFGSDGNLVEHTHSWKEARVHPDDRERVLRSFEAARGEQAVRWNAEYRFERSDGSYIDVEDRGYLLRDERGRAYRVIGSMRDVTEMKRLLAREQEARSVAERASRAKDEFLAMLGHELRNPLAPIVTGLELLRERGGKDLERNLTVLQRQAAHLIRLVDDLLDVSRIAHGKIELKKERLELGTVVAAAIETANPLIESRDHALVLDVPARELQVIGDRARLAQTVSNLLTNAAKYTEPGGTITVSARRTDAMIELTVRDTGIGIAPEMLPHVFAMFVQEQQALDRALGGLGLGLSIVRSLVDLHGGTVHAASEGRGRGSAFTIKLPAAPPAVAAAPGPAASARTGARGGHKIMVVDDNEDAADLLATLLERLGNTTRVAHDATAALQLVDEFAPELAVLDIGLPVIDGYELAQQLRRREGNEHMHLIALTGYGQASDKERAARAGFDAHLVKPVALDTLQKVIAQLCLVP